MRKRISILYLLLTIILTAFIFSNSCRTAAVSSEQSGRIVDFIAGFCYIDKGTLTVIVRKLAHFFEFFLQALSASLFVISIKGFPKHIIYILFGGLFTACCDEFLQLFFDGRGAMVSDIFIDFSGTLTGILLCTAIYFIIQKKNRTV